MRQQRVREEEPGHDRHPGLGAQQHGAAVDGIGDRAADERYDEQRDQRGETEQPDEGRRVGQRVHLVRHRDDPDLAADRRDRLPDPEVAEVAAPQRARIDAHAPEEAGPLSVVERVDRHQSSAIRSQR